MDGRHIKREGGYIRSESAKPWWVAGPGFMLVFDYLGHWSASKLVVVVIVALAWTILKAIFS